MRPAAHAARVLVLASLVWAPHARAQGVRIPEGALAWWRLDPSGFSAAGAPTPERIAALAALRVIVAGGLVSDEQGRMILQGVLAAAEVGAARHTLVMTDFAGVRDKGGVGMKVERLQMALAIDRDEGRRSILRSIRAILAGDPEGVAGEQRALPLPGGAPAVAYREEGWPAWREISWSSSDDRFVVGLGEGAIETLVGAQVDGGVGGAPGGAAEEAPWLAHQRLVDAGRPDGDVFLEAYLDFDAFRERFPSAFEIGRTPRTLRTLGLLDAHDVMIHGRWVESAGRPPIIALDATWVDEGGALRRAALTHDAWPGDQLAMAPPPGSYLVIMSMDWSEAARRVFDVVEATRRASKLDAFGAFRAQWERANAQNLTGFLGSLSPWLVLSDVPPPAIPAPGATTAFVELRDGADADAALAALGGMLAPVEERVGVNEKGVWSVRLDANGVVRAPAWGVAQLPLARALVVGWSPAVVEHNRALGRR